MHAHLPAVLRPAAAAAALAVAVLGACGGESREAVPTAREFVGRVGGVEESATLVALVVDAPAEGGTPVRAYLCDGERIFEWFSGSAQGESLKLTSKAGARLDATVSDRTARGTVTVANGIAYEFDVPLATGFAGLFEVTSTEDGTFDATSVRGARLTGSLKGSDIGINLTSPEGEAAHVSAALDSPTLRSARWIVSADGQTIKGTDVHPMQEVREKVPAPSGLR